MDGLVQCNRTRASTRSVTGRISDHSSRVTADSIRMDRLTDITTDTPHLFHHHIHIALLHIYKRPRPIWLLGFPARYHTIVLFLLFPQRCSCQRQPMGGGRRHSCDGGLCSTFIFRLLMDTG